MRELIGWKNSKGRMPLVLEGARQTGKTWLLKEFGRTQYKNAVYVNFDQDQSVHTCFEGDLDPERIVRELEYRAGSKIQPGETLIIFDEIQECNRALVSLKYFCENAPQYHVASAGSLLGVAIHHGNSFPVGKVNTVHLYPLNFGEFLDALGENRHKHIITEKAFDSLYVLETDLIRRLKEYYFVGGMPKAVASFAEDSRLDIVREIQLDILTNYERDFSKHITPFSIPQLGMIWNSIPVHLGKEKKQFIYKELKQGARRGQFEEALYWLETIGLVYRLYKVETPRLPLMAYRQEPFKLFMLDVGLLSAQAGLTGQNLAQSDPEVFDQFRGALTEQFVLQELQCLNPKPAVFYWENNPKKGSAEVDFVIQYEGNIIPVEAKSSINLKAKSLKTYMDYYQPKIAVRTSLARYSRNKSLFDIPLYAIGWLGEFIGDAMKG
jgi:predicted AAA+ superfamily ATPase